MKDKLEQQASGAPRTAVLLGAGASVDAGLPVTSDLASAILDKANHGFFQPPMGKGFKRHLRCNGRVPRAQRK